MGDGRGGRWGAEPRAAIIAMAIVVSLIGLLLLPLSREVNGGSANGVTIIANGRELCFDCAADAPYPALVWLELIVALAGLLVGLSLCFRGEGWKMVVRRSVVLVAAGLILLWAPLQIDARERPIAIVPVFVAMGIGAMVLTAVAVRRSRSTWVGVTRAVVLAVAAIALTTVPGTRRQMPFTYDRLLWGYVVAIVATAVATIVAIMASTASSGA
jgi:hypothetical protein